MAKQEFTGSVALHRQAFMEVADGARLNVELIGQLGKGAALLLRVAKASSSPDARVAERWLSTVVGVAALVGCALEDVQ